MAKEGSTDTAVATAKDVAEDSKKEVVEESKESVDGASEEVKANLEEVKTDESSRADSQTEPTGESKSSTDA